MTANAVSISQGFTPFLHLLHRNKKNQKTWEDIYVWQTVILTEECEN